MARLFIHVEGQTEETFVHELLRDHLVANGFDAVQPRIVGNARLRKKRGGIRSWPSVRKDITNHLKEDSSCIATTMVDYYGLPREGDAAWPGRATVRGQSSMERARFVEAAMLEDVIAEMGNQPYPERFVPFVVMHEFEGLLFSDCTAFSRGINRSDLESDFKLIRDRFSTPEDINDSPDTAPSKRVEALVPGYQKPLLGTLAVLEIGLPRIRSECPHFHQWLERLESMVR